MKWFDQHYPRLISGGIVALIWFSALARGAHDLWAASVVFFGTTLLFVLFCVGRARSHQPVIVPLGIPTVLFVIALLFSSWHSYDVDTSVFELWGWIFILLLSFLFVNTVTLEDRDFFFTTAGMVLVPVMLLSLWQQCTDPLIHTDRFHSVCGPLVNSMILAGFALNWVFYLGSRAVGPHRVQRLMFIACLMTLLMAKSVTSFLCVMVGFAYLLRNRFKTLSRPTQKIAIGIGVFLFLGCFIIFLHKIGGYFVGVHTWTGRLYYWRAAFRMWRQYPLTGVGLGAFGTAFPYFRSGTVQGTLYAHSFPIGWVAETGMLGAVTLLLFGVAYVRLLCLHGRQKISDPFTSVLLVTLMAVAVYSVININLNYLINKLMFLLVMASALLPVKLPHYRVRPIVWMSLSLIAVLVAPFWWSLFSASRLYVFGQQMAAQGHWPEAEASWQNAIAIDPFHSDSYWALSQLYVAKAIHQDSDENRARAARYLNDALQYKRDIRYREPVNRKEAVSGGKP